MTSSNSYLLNTISSDARKCQFASVAEIEMLDFRGAPYWHILMQCRHVGIHRPDERICNWTARLLTKDKRYIQRCLGPALDTGRGAPLSYEEAVELALQWFDAPESVDIAHSARPTGRMERLSVSPIGSVYTVGHALNDYCHWTLLARSAGTHYNNLVLINYHIVPDFAQISLEEFNASHLAKLARNVLSTPPRFGFMARQLPVLPKELTPDELRRRKRTFNSLVSILRRFVTRGTTGRSTVNDPGDAFSAFRWFIRREPFF